MFGFFVMCYFSPVLLMLVEDACSLFLGCAIVAGGRLGFSLFSSTTEFLINTRRI